MPKVKVTPNPMYNPIGVRLLLGEVGVQGPMLQDESGITCMMSEDQISRFRNSRGAAHRIDVIPDPPPPVIVPDPEPIPESVSEQEPPESDPATPEPPTSISRAKKAN